MVLPLIAAGVAAGGSLIGSAMASARAQAAERARRRYMASLDSQLYGSMGEAPDTQAGPSQMAGVYSDPGLVANQNEYLQRLHQQSFEGLNPQDRLSLAQIGQEQQQQERGSREAILQRARATGQIGGGAALGAQLSGSQNAANAARMQGLGVADVSSRRSLDALSRYGMQAGQMRDQGFNESTQRARAADAMRQFNAGQRGAQYDRGLQKAGARAGLLSGNGQSIANEGQMAANFTGAAANMLGQGAATLAGNYMDSQRPSPRFDPYTGERLR